MIVFLSIFFLTGFWMVMDHGIYLLNKPNDFILCLVQGDQQWQVILTSKPWAYDTAVSVFGSFDETHRYSTSFLNKRHLDSV